MNNKKVIILLVYIMLIVVISVVTFSVENQLWRYDKYVHFFEFFILGILIVNIFLSDLNLKRFILLLLLITFIAFLDEGVQYLIPARSADINDLYSDLLGGYSGILLIYLLKDKLNG